jgi:hypothetical protein
MRGVSWTFMKLYSRGGAFVIFLMRQETMDSMRQIGEESRIPQYI